MKKIISLFLTFGMVLAFTGCGQQKEHNSNNKLDIASQEWIMTTIQSQSVEDNGLIVAYGTDSSASEQAVRMDMTCSAEKGLLSLTDQTNNKTYSGKYTVKSSSAESVIYDISVEDAVGMAVVSFTNYEDDRQANTLILSFEGYALTFLGKNQ